ncbi:hypothetical protein [Mariniflexile maritimum]|uniref:hypothetical protein n=1 Tax=Mariniflexile maritimum TaxID=2682493 RepID=UPI0012F6E1E1|nr:hypothetical protein [Mariniflexile maritimum]
MKAITKFLEALSDNYYEKFLIENPYIQKDYENKYYSEVLYNKKVYYEIELDDISTLITEILLKLKAKYKKAISEVYIEIANKSSSEIHSIIENLIKSVNVNLKVIKNDFYIYDKNSRYFSETNFNSQDFSIQSAINLFSEEINNGKYFDVNKNVFSSFDLYYESERGFVLSYLPVALFTIGNAFILELIRIKEEAISNEIKIAIPETSKLKWDGKPAHLGYIIGMLADSEFLDAPKRDSGDINYTQFAKQVLNVFNVNTTENTLSKYLNTTTEKAQETKRKFDEIGFDIPHKKRVN